MSSEQSLEGEELLGSTEEAAESGTHVTFSTETSDVGGVHQESGGSAEGKENRNPKPKRHKSSELAQLLLYTDTSLLLSSQNEERLADIKSEKEDSEDYSNLRELIRSKWEYAASMQFLQMFGEDLNVSEFYTEDVEDALVSTNESTLLIELHVKLMKGLITHGFPPHEWQIVLRKTIEKYLDMEEAANLLNNHNEEEAKDTDEDNVEDFGGRKRSRSIEKHDKFWKAPVWDENGLYWSLRVEDKVMILYKLCEWQLLDIEKFRSRIKDIEQREGDWRVEPLGYDAKNNIIWLFDDNRLYQESKNSGKRKSEPEWKLICSEIEDWEAFTTKCKQSRNSNEKALFKTLSENILPIIMPQLQDKVKQIRKRELHEAFSIKKSTRFQSRLASQKFEGTTSIFDVDPKLSLEKQFYVKEQAEREQRTKEREDRLRLREERLRALEEEKILKEVELAKEREERLAQREKRKLGIPLAETLNEFELKTESAPKLPKKRNVRKLTGTKSWYFECLCGLKGTNYDDGTDMIQCTDCLVWQHIACDKTLAHFVLSNQDYSKFSTSSAPDQRKQKDKRLEDVDFVCRKCLKRRKQRDKHLRKKISRIKTEIQQVKQGFFRKEHEARDDSSEDHNEIVDIEASYHEPTNSERRLKLVFRPSSDTETISCSDQLNIIITDSNPSASDDISPHLTSEIIDEFSEKNIENGSQDPSLVIYDHLSVQPASKGQTDPPNGNPNFVQNQDESFSLDFLSAIALQRHEEGFSPFQQQDPAHDPRSE